jgi:ERCC4-related helicase
MERENEPLKNEKEAKSKSEGKSISLRNFQATLFQNSQDRNSIIYLPTGTGKTRIAICSMYYYLCKFGTTKKIVFLANTIQLVKQQAEAIKQTLTSIVQNEGFGRDLRQRLGENYIQLNWSEKDISNQVICVHGERSEDPTTTKRRRIEAYLTTKKEFIN